MNDSEFDKTVVSPVSKESGYNYKPFAPNALVVALFIVLIVAVLVQGALLVRVYLTEGRNVPPQISNEEPADGTELVVKSDIKTAGSGSSSLSKSLSTAPLTGSLSSGDLLSSDRGPFAEMARMREHMDQLFANRVARFGLFPGIATTGLYKELAFGGNASMSEDDGSYVLALDLPGADEASLDIDLSDGVLAIRGEREEVHEKAENSGQVISRSKSVSSFQRSFVLPEDADSFGMTSNFSGGVLTITVPKK